MPDAPLTSNERLCRELAGVRDRQAAVKDGQTITAAIELIDTQDEEIERLRAALKELVEDEWRCTVDWGPREPRTAILERCHALIDEGAAVETTAEHK